MRTILTRCTAIFAILTLVIAGAAPVSAASRRYVALSVGYQHNCALPRKGRRTAGDTITMGSSAREIRTTPWLRFPLLAA